MQKYKRGHTFSISSKGYPNAKSAKNVSTYTHTHLEKHYKINNTSLYSNRKTY